MNDTTPLKEPLAQKRTTPLAISARGLVRHFGEVKAVDGIDLDVPRGMIFAILGPNGAGKTTLIRMLATLLKPDAGTATVMGHDLVAEPHAVRASIALTGQFASLDEDLTARENLILLARLWGFRGREAKARADELLAAFELADAAKRQVKDFSGGMRRRLDIAASLIVTPGVLFLDEPTTGLDPRARQTLWGVVEAFRSAGGTVLLTTHYMEEAATLCDELAVMDQGRIIARGSPRALIDSLGEVQFVDFESPQTPDSAALLALPAVHAVDRRGARYRLRIERSLRALTAVLEELERQGVTPIGLSTHQATLDDVFLHLTGRGLSHE